MSVRLFIGNLPYAANEAELREHLSSVGAPSQVVLPVDRETGRPRGFAFVDYAGPQRRRRSHSTIQPATLQRPAAGGQRGAPARGARPGRIQRPATRRVQRPTPGARRWPGRTAAWRLQRSTSSGRIQPRPDTAAAPPGTGPRSRNFGPDAPPKNKRKPPRKDSDRGPKGPIKERPVSRLYDADDDWRAQDEEVDADNVATAAKEDDDAVAAPQGDDLDEEQD